VVASGVGGVLVIASASGVATTDGNLTSKTSSVRTTVVTSAALRTVTGLRAVASVARRAETTAGASLRGSVKSRAILVGAEVVGTTNTLLVDTVGLAADGSHLGQVGSLPSRTNAEDGGLPLVALSGKLLVLGSLGADTAGKGDVLEDAVVLGDGHVDLLIGSDLILLLLALGELLLGGGGVALVDVLDVLGVGVVPGLSLSLLGLLVDGEEHLIELMDVVADLGLCNLLDSRTHNLEEKRLEHVEEKLVVGLLQLDVDVLDVNVDRVDLEEVLAVGLVCSLHGDLETKTGTTKEDVHDTLVSNTGEALLLLDVVADVAKVALDARDGKHDLVLVLASDGLAAPAPVVVAAELHDVGSKVVTLEDEVLDDSVHHGVGVLDARNRDVADGLEETGEDNLGQILDEMRLELSLAVLILTEVEEELLDSITEGDVLSVLVELIDVELELIGNSVGVVAVAVTEEELALVVELVPLLGGRVLEDVALLLEALADVLVHVSEPALKLGITVGIAVDDVDGVEHVVQRGAVGEALDESLEVGQHVLVIHLEL